MAFMMVKKVKGAIMVGIMFVSVIAWIPGHDASYLGSHSQAARDRLHEFKKVLYYFECVHENLGIWKGN